MCGIILKKAKGFKGKRIIVRIHESGDFYNKAYFLKWVEIAKICRKVDKRIVFLAYTKSVRFVAGVKIPKNLVLRYSIMLELEKTAISSVNNKPKCRVSMEEIIKLAHAAAQADWKEWHERWENSNSNPLIYVRESRAWNVFDELDRLIKHETSL